MKLFTLFLAFFISLSSIGQTSNCCKEFEAGCWTLIGSSNGVEVYVTHKKTTRPGNTTGFNITVFSKIVNTNDHEMISDLGVSASFYFKPVTSNVLSFKEISMDKNLDPRQTIVKYIEVFTNLNEIMYSQIRPFRYIKKP